MQASNEKIVGGDEDMEIDSASMALAQTYYHKYQQLRQAGKRDGSLNALHQAVKLDPFDKHISDSGFIVLNEIDDEALALYNAKDYGAAYVLANKYEGYDNCVEDGPLLYRKNKCLAMFKKYRKRMDSCISEAKDTQFSLAERVDCYNLIISTVYNNDPARPGERNKMKQLRAELIPDYQKELLTKAKTLCDQHNFNKALKKTEKGAKYVPELDVFQALPAYVKIRRQQSNRKPLIDDHLVLVFKAAHQNNAFMVLIKPLSILKTYNKWVRECFDDTLSHPERFRLMNKVLSCATEDDTLRLTKLRDTLMADYQEFLSKEIRDFCSRDQYDEAKSLIDEALSIFPDDRIFIGMSYSIDAIELKSKEFQKARRAGKPIDADLEDRCKAIVKKIAMLNTPISIDPITMSLLQNLSGDLGDRKVHHEEETGKLLGICGLLIEEIVVASLNIVNIDKAKGKAKKCIQPMKHDYEALRNKISTDLFTNKGEKTLDFLRYYMRQSNEALKKTFIKSAAKCVLNCASFKKGFRSNTLTLHPDNYALGSINDVMANFLDRMTVGIDTFVKADTVFSPINPPRAAVKPSHKKSAGWNIVHPSVDDSRVKTMVFQRGPQGQGTRSDRPPEYSSVFGDNDNSNNAVTPDDTNSSETSSSPKEHVDQAYEETGCVF